MGAHFWDKLRSFFSQPLNFKSSPLILCVFRWQTYEKSWTSQIKEIIKKKKKILPKFIPNDDWGLNLFVILTNRALPNEAQRSVHEFQILGDYEAVMKSPDAKSL